MAKTKKVNENEDKFLLRIDKGLKSKAEKQASESDRSLNGHIVNLVREDLKSKGVM